MLQARMQGHRVGFSVMWQLDPAEFGTDRYIDAKGEDAKALVIERLLSGAPTEVEFLIDEHDFGDGTIGGVHRSLDAPWDVLREVADRLEAEAEECEP
jgi:hypothetical protein